MNWNIGQMNYVRILVLLAIGGSCYKLPFIVYLMTRKRERYTERRVKIEKNQNSMLPEGEILLQEILRNRVPRYDVSVIYLKTQDYQI